MARKLKTYVTSMGFFDLAVAAPSMKAALEAWGVERNLFQSGFAEESDDPKIVAATLERPGVVLRRAVGSKGAYTEHAGLPKKLPAAVPKQPPARRANEKAKPKSPPSKASETKQKAAIIRFDKEKARREQERAKADAERERQEERGAREDEKRRKAVEKARAILARAAERHDANMEDIDRQRQTAEDNADAERERWRREKAKLEEAVREADH